MGRRRDLPDSFDGRAFTVSGAVAGGVPPKRLRANDLATPHRGLRVPRGLPLELEEILRPLQELVPRGVAYRTTAARIHGIPLPGWAEEQGTRLELAVPAGTSQIRRPGLAVRRLELPETDVVVRGGIRTTSPERTFADLASLLRLVEIVVAGDYLVCEHGPEHPASRQAVVPLPELASYIRGVKGRHGIVRAREALDLVRVGADSPPETRLRLAAAELGLPDPVLGLVLRDRFGRPVLYPDLAFPDYKVAVQYDGGHHAALAQTASDARRESTAWVLGWKSVVLTRADVAEGDYVGAALRIRAALRSRGWDPESPLRLGR